MDRRVEIVSTVARRRRWTVEKKVSILDEAAQPGASVTAVADRHGISRNLIYLWRRQAREGLMPGVTMADEALPGFVPVRIADSPEPVVHNGPAQLPVPQGRRRHWPIEITLRNGRAVKVDEGVDPGALARIVAALDGCGS